MPTYDYMCIKERGGCGQEFSGRKSVESRYNVECPCCGAWGGKKKKDGTRVISIWHPTPPAVRVDINQQEGRSNEDVAMPAFGPETHIHSRRQLKELQLRAREEIYASTGGTKVLNVTDPDTGAKETITVEREGLDVGEIHTAEARPEPIDHGAQARAKVIKQIAEERAARGH